MLGLTALTFGSSLVLAWFLRGDYFGGQDLLGLVFSAIDFFCVTASGLLITIFVSKIFAAGWKRTLAGCTAMAAVFLLFPAIQMLGLLLSSPDLFLSVLSERIQDVLAFPVTVLSTALELRDDPGMLWRDTVRLVEATRGDHFQLAEIYSKWFFLFALVLGSHEILASLTARLRA